MATKAIPVLRNRNETHNRCLGRLLAEGKIRLAHSPKVHSLYYKYIKSLLAIASYLLPRDGESSRYSRHFTKNVSDRGKPNTIKGNYWAHLI